jgi:hypothetical protein
VESSGELIGSYGEKSDGRHPGLRGSEGQLLGTAKKSGEFSHPSRDVVGPAEQVLARIWLDFGGKTATRRYREARVIRFDRNTGPEVRALTLAYATAPQRYD